jgi:hypothetical protein
MSFQKSLLITACSAILFGATQARAEVINFENYTGPDVFGGPPQTLNVSTSIGNVIVSGGVILTNETNLPADESSVYGTAFIGSYSNTITLKFPSNINNFFLNIYNGETYADSFTVADNLGHSNTVTIQPNLQGGMSLVSFPAAGDTVTISTTDTAWDFSIDNVGFNQPTPGAAAPEPASIGMMGAAGLGLALLNRFRRARFAK